MHSNLYILGASGLLFIALLTLAIIDFRKFILPDILTLPLTALGLLFSWLFSEAITSSLIGMATGYCGFRLVEIGYKKFRGIDGLGRGDAKLLAAGGAWCGWFGLPFIVLIASASGLAHAFLLSTNKDDKTQILPFGPHLALGIFMTWLALNFTVIN